MSVEERILIVAAGISWTDSRELRAIALEFRKMEDRIKQLEDRIKRLEEGGHELRECASQLGWTSSDDSRWIERAESAVEAWDKAKEAKP